MWRTLIYVEEYITSDWVAWYFFVLDKVDVSEIGLLDSYSSGNNVSRMKYISESQARVQGRFEWFDWGGPHFRKNKNVYIYMYKYRFLFYRYSADVKNVHIDVFILYIKFFSNLPSFRFTTYTGLAGVCMYSTYYMHLFLFFS